MTGFDLGPFHLVRPIGRGGMGVVWRGVHRAQQVAVAVKFLAGKPHHAAAFARAFETEAAAVAALHHPSIVMLFDYGLVPAASAVHGLAEGSPYLAMELAGGGSLDRLAHAPDWDQVSGILRALLDALAHAHARGVVHRDLKPSNVLVAGPDDLRPGIKLTDFGIAVSASVQAGADPVTGTPRYMAPEQFESGAARVGPWTDLYSLGCVAWELATGAPPRSGRQAVREAQRDDPSAPPEFQPRIAVPPGFEAWLHGLLAADPASRFRRAADAAWAFSRLGDADPSLKMEQPLRPRDSGETMVDFLTTQVEPDPTLISLVAGAPAAAPVEPAVRHPAPLPADWRRAEPPQAQPRLEGAGLGLFALRVPRMVGRSEERDAIWRAFRETVTSGRPHALVLGGQSGVGKSRIAGWMAERIHELGVGTPLLVRHQRLGSAGHGLVPALVRHVGLSELPSHERIAALAARMDPSSMEPGELEALAGLLADPDDVGWPLGREAREGLLRRALSHLAGRRPLLLWLDDVQWGPAAIALTRTLLREPSAGPILAVLTAQDEALSGNPIAASDLAELAEHPRCETVRVAPLDPDAARTLVSQLLTLDAATAEDLAARTEGNPLFAISLLGDWVHRRVLVAGDDGFTLAAGADAPLPDDLHGVWAGRIEAATLSDAGRTAIEVAAVLGGDVDHDEWVAVCEHQGVQPPAPLLGRLLRQRLAIATPAGWAFAHGMVRESAERTAREGGRWARSNAAAAAALAARPAPPNGRIGRHWLEAEESSQAADALLAAADTALVTDNPRLAMPDLALAEHALEAARAPSEDPRWGRLWLAQSRALRLQEALDEAQLVAGRAARAAAAHGWPAVHAGALAQQADISRLRGDLPVAAELFSDSLARYRALGDRAGEASTLRSLAYVALLRGNADEGEAALEEARAVYTTLGDRPGLAMCLAGMGDLARVRRQWDRAAVLFRQALTLNRQLGNRSGVALGRHGLGEVHRLTGQLDAAEQDYREVIRIDTALGRDTTIPRLNLALCRIAQGAYADAEAALLLLERAWGQQGRTGYLAIAHIALLPCFAVRGAWREWRRDLALATTLLGETSLVDLDVARLCSVAGDLASAAGETERAREAWMLSRAQWTALGDDEGVQRLDTALATLR